MDHLWSPWRMQYLQQNDETSPSSRQSGASATGLLKPPSAGDQHGTGCIFCDLPAENRDLDNLIVHRGQRAFVILNRYPYNNGHLMVVPFSHAPSLEQLDAPTLTEIMLLVNQSLGALRAAYQPQAFNLGVNIGAAAGAGIADHVHMHIVPRWSGDTNYMSTVAGTRVIPEDLRDTYRVVQESWPKQSA
jgi:ATP adenylyltransferase